MPSSNGIKKDDLLIVEDKEGTKKGTVEQLNKALGVSELNEALVDIDDSLFTKVDVPIDVSEIKGIKTKLGYSGSATDTALSLTQLDGYDSYYFIAEDDYDVYFDADNVPVSKYVAICYGSNYTSEEIHSSYINFNCSNGVRLRNSEHTLPTETNKLHIEKGGMVIFTFTAGYRYNVYGFKTKRTTDYDSKYSGTVSFNDNLLDIKMKNAHYEFKKITNSSINVDTWRLYKGDIIKQNGLLFNMWTDSDAEGVVQINGEADFIGGYHGDEKFNKINVFVDGNEIDMNNPLNETKFKVLSIYVESDVYHCNTSELHDVIAFKRNKYLKFESDSVTIGNEWTAQSNLNIVSAPLALFQTFNYDSDELVTTNYMVDTDYKLYDIATPNVHPTNSPKMNKFKIENKYGSISFNSIKTSGQKPMGVVAYNFFESQKRIKLYYYTIYGNTDISAGDKLVSEFKFTIN